MSGNTTWKESISLEETNKIRVSLGLKPLSETAAPKDADAQAHDNFQKRKDQEAADRESAALKARIDKARNAKERARRLGGVGLGEAEEGEDLVKREEGGDDGADTKAWIKKQKKRAKELAAKRAKELDEMEKRAAEEGLAKYGEEDLKGIKVAHGEDDFEEGEETVLTLKDSRVLDDEDDELHNLNISENTKTAEALALKKKGRTAGQYTGYDDDEFDPTKVGSARGVLNKYDEEILGKEESGFRLGSAPTVPKGEKKGKGKGKEEEQEEKERVKLSMDYTKSFNTDYLQEGDVGFKVKKKKKRPPTRVPSSSLADDIDPTAMDVDSPATSAAPTLTHTNLDETNLIDDDDLQASLARSRREASKKKILEMKKRKEALAAAGPGEGMELDRVKEESDDEGATGGGGGGGGDADDVLVLDDTSEFVRNITLAAAAPPALRTNGAVAVKKEEGAQSVMPVIKAEPEDVPLAELGDGALGGGEGGGGWGAAREDGEESDEDMAMGGIDSVVPSTAEDVKPKVEDDEIGGSSGSVLVSKGMASTLSLLRHQGLIVPRTPEELERDRVQKEREAWLAAQRKRDREREEEKQRSRAAGSSIDQQQREYENRMREQRDAQATLEAFNNYKPNVNLTYHDEFGRDQTPKEAWKQLSHSFHGKGSGSKKTEKRLAKIAAEQKARAMASGDTPLNTAAAFAARAERTGSATMVLSVGNKGSAPIQDEMLTNLNKPKGKGKATSSSKLSTSNTTTTNDSAPPSAVFNDIPMRPLPIGSPSSATASPAPRAGFAPVRGFAPEEPSSRDQSPMQQEKIAIPMQVKRKAQGEANGAPAAKR
ncbi:SART-1 protein [Leucosporidium creatinivorum]|uniref:SART-1 protein n=1 Tax=Leucosporidium creatinivorum TaxID=106004 RepID=A0A1Y2G4M2_9BASI|nr:SART-1 protein [Leucosporidium creatinivorum]